jgi:hypothetical protein
MSLTRKLPAEQGGWRGVGMTLAEAMQVFLNSREAIGCTPATLRTYRIDLDAFFDASSIPQLADLAPEAVETYLAGLRSQMKPI